MYVFDSHRGFSLPRVVPCFHLLGLTPGGLFMGSISTKVYTSELILRFSICERYAAQHSYVPLLPLCRDSPPKSSPLSDLVAQSAE